MADVRIGTSGWQYRHWREAFYPAGLPMTRWFEHYTSRFDTVEVNSSFYHLPQETAFRKWGREAPEGFLYAVKGNRYITHLRKLSGVEESVKLFVERCRLLGPKLGPMLWQLPPNLGYTPERLEGLLSLLPRDVPQTLEARHPSWADPACFDQLRRRGVAWCISDTPSWDYTRALRDAGHVSPLGLRLGEVAEWAWEASPFLYARLHGYLRLYDTDHGDAELRLWADVLRRWSAADRDVYVYFDNDGHAYAPRNALRLRQLLLRES